LYLDEAVGPNNGPANIAFRANQDALQAAAVQAAQAPVQGPGGLPPPIPEGLVPVQGPAPPTGQQLYDRDFPNGHVLIDNDNSQLLSGVIALAMGIQSHNRPDLYFAATRPLIFVLPQG